MNFALTRKEIILKVLAPMLAAVSCLGHFYYQNAAIIYIVCLICCGGLLWSTARYKPIFIFYCFASTYIIFLFPYFLNNVSIGYSQLNRVDLYQKTIFLFSILLISLLFFFKDQDSTPVSWRLPVYDSNLVYSINIIVISLITLFGASGNSVFEQSYGTGGGSMATIYTYFPIFYLATYFASGRRKMKVMLLNAIGIVFVAKSLLLGGRGNAISMAIVIYVLFIDTRISFRMLLLLLIVGVSFFSMWGQLRTNGVNLAKVNLSDVWSLGIAYKDKYTLTANNQTDVFYASVRIVSMVDMGVISTSERMLALWYFCVSVFVPYSMLPPLANLSTYNINNFFTLGGGLIFSYFYTYLSYFGLILVGFLINKIWNQLRTSTNKYMLMYCIMVLSTMNAWFAYSPINLFKMCVWGVFYIFAMDVINNTLRARKT